MNEVWFINVVRVELGMLIDRSIEDFKKKLDEQVLKWQEDYEVFGVVIGIVYEGCIVYIFNYGYVDKKIKKVVSDDILFQVGFIFKSFIVWGILYFVDEGCLLLDDFVGKYLIKWKLFNLEFNNNEVMIRRLLSYIVGLFVYKGYFGVVLGKYFDFIEEFLFGKGWFNELVEVINKLGLEIIYFGGGYIIL